MSQLFLRVAAAVGVAYLVLSLVRVIVPELSGPVLIIFGVASGIVTSLLAGRGKTAERNDA